MAKKIIKSFGELEKEWCRDENDCGRLVTVRRGGGNDNLLFWFWLMIGIVLLIICPLSGIISIAFWAIIFRKKIKKMTKDFLRPYRRI